MAGRARPGSRSRADLAGAASLLALGGALLLGGCQAAAPTPKAATDASLMNAQVQSAKQAEANYNYSDAVGIYQTLYSQHPDNLDFGTGLARNMRFSGQASSEIGLVNDLIAKNGRSVPLLLELGKAYLAADQDNLALPTLLEAKTKEPGNWEVLSTLGVAYDYQGSYADARDAYAQALIASPSNPTVLNNLALSQASSGDLDGAIATLQQAIDQPAALAQTRQNLALLLALKGDPDSAERLARKDLPPEIADGNMAYFRMISAAAKGGTAAPASVTVPATTSSAPAVEPTAEPITEPATEPTATDSTGAASSAQPAATAAPILPILPPPAAMPAPTPAPAPAAQSIVVPQAKPTAQPQDATSPQDSEAVR